MKTIRAQSAPPPCLIGLKMDSLAEKNDCTRCFFFQNEDVVAIEKFWKSQYENDPGNYVISD